MGQLLQEKYWNGDPWRVLVVCILLNQTTGTTAEPTIKLLFETWPDAGEMEAAVPEVLRLTIEHLGFGLKRTNYLLQLSRVWRLMAQTGRDMRTVSPENFAGCGPYAKEAWDLIVLGRRDFVPRDKELRRRLSELRIGQH